MSLLVCCMCFKRELLGIRLKLKGIQREVNLTTLFGLLAMGFGFIFENLGLSTLCSCI